jgi:hypothetical protein
MDLFKIVAGILLLLLGKRLFWLFVGLTGFWAGMMFAPRLLPPGTSDVVHVIAAVACGFVGILLAFFLQRLAIALSGFFAGGYFGLSLATQLGWASRGSEWIFFLITGIVAAILLSVLFDWALIFLSSAVGATLLIEALHFPQLISLALFVILVLIGIAIQSRMLTARTVRTE